MAIPTWVAGQVLAAADVNSWFVPTGTVVKSSDQTLTANTTLTNDSALFASVVANAIYYFSLDLLIVANATARFNSQFTGPAGASLNCGIMGFNAGATFGATSRQAFSSPVVFDGNGVGVVPLWFRGNVITGGTAGTFQFMWAQSVSNGTGCTVKAGSQLYITRIA